jgi:hypothetical protein
MIFNEVLFFLQERDPMNKLYISLALLLTVVAVDARNSHTIKSVESCLKDIRGRFCVTGVTTDPTTGKVTGVTEVNSGGKGYSIKNVSVQNQDVTAVYNAVGVPVAAATLFVISADITFDKPFRDVPTIALSIQSNATGFLVTPPSFSVDAANTFVTKNQTRNGFTGVTFLTFFGTSDAANQANIVATLTSGQACSNFIAQGRASKKQFFPGQ